jgi:nucleotide sugar dehydrogenase
MKKYTVCVVGLGNIGLAVAKYIKKQRTLLGYDISSKAIIRAQEHGINALTQLPNDDVYVVCVNTWFRDGKPDMSAIDDCCRKMSDKNSKALVCFESTLSLGTARKMASKYHLNKVAVCPHRWWSVDETNHGVNQPRVLGALNEESMDLAIEFYQSLNIPTTQTSSLEIAELSKVVENTHYYLEIAYAEELKRLTDHSGLNFDELKRVVNTKWNVKLLEPRDGIGGECLPKDIQYLKTSVSTELPLISGAIKADELFRNELS